MQKKTGRPSILSGIKYPLKLPPVSKGGWGGKKGFKDTNIVVVLVNNLCIILLITYLTICNKTRNNLLITC